MLATIPAMLATRRWSCIGARLKHDHDIPCHMIHKGSKTKDGYFHNRSATTHPQQSWSVFSVPWARRTGDVDQNPILGADVHLPFVS